SRAWGFDAEEEFSNQVLEVDTYPCPFLMIPELPAISLLFSSVAPNYVRYSISGPQFHLQSAIPFPVRSSISYPLLHL
ncbi:hypothetical protein OSL37_25205, partial [Escherichia coli]|nr:hypothetical protein [Escherichia coli]